MITETNQSNQPITPEATPEVQVPSISSGASMVELSISVWTGRKLDKSVSAEITAQKQAAQGVASVSKKLLGDCAELVAVQKFAANVRNTHYVMTMPWSDSGMRLLTTAMFFDYHNKMTTAQAEFEGLVDTFLNVYAYEIMQSQAKLGNLFNADEYPSTDSLRSKFKFNIAYIPMPDHGDWRLDINNEAKTIMQDSYRTYYEDKLNTAMADIWQRCYDALNRMSERLDYKDKDTKKIFRDSLVENVLDICDLLSKCNVTGDSRMEAMRINLENMFSGVTADALREDDYLRMDTKRKVDAVLSNMSW